MTSELKLSICTNVMSRLEHLKQTYIQNLETCNCMTNIDFVLLNYNCQEGTHDWVRDNLMKYIESGKLKYFHENTVKHFHMSKAKNLSHRLSEGALLMNLDADNYLNVNTINFVLSEFTSADKKIARGYDKISGLIIVKREDFFSVNGYNESFIGWGYEELDLFERISRHCNYQQSDICLLRRLKKIRHGHRLRLVNMDLKNKRNPLISNRLNKRKSDENIRNKNYVANRFQNYIVYKNFSDTSISV